MWGSRSFIASRCRSARKLSRTAPAFASRLRGSAAQRSLRVVASAVAVTALAAIVAAASMAAPSRRGTRQTFTFAVPYLPTSLDVAKSLSTVPQQIMSLVTEPLVRLTSTGEVLPNLATKVTKPNSTTLVFTIRPGIRFSDGRSLTAADVVWSIDHVTNPKAQTSGNFASFAKATATGRLKVTVKLKHPDPTAEAGLASIAFIQEAKFAAHHATGLGTPGAVPIGTGPYKVSSDTAQNVTLVANPDYWGPKPTIAKLVFTPIAEDSVAELAMRSHSIQAASVGDLRNIGQWLKVPGTTISSGPALTSDFLSMDTAAAPFNDIHVRLAVAYSIDRYGIFHAGFGHYGYVLKGLIPAGELLDVAPSASAVTKFLSGLPQYNLNLAKAKAELAESAFPKGFSVTVPYVSTDPIAELVVLNLQQNLKPLGITVTPQPETENQWIQAFFTHTMTGIQLIEGFTATEADPASVLGKGGVVGTVNLTQGGFNEANWASPAIDRAVADMTSLNKSLRWQQSKFILRQVADQVPYVPLFDPSNAWAVAAGWKFTRPMTLFDFYNGDWISYLKAT